MKLSESVVQSSLVKRHSHSPRKCTNGKLLWCGQPMKAAQERWEKEKSEAMVCSDSGDEHCMQPTVACV